MIDLHCHILPGVDDGAQTMEESLEMAREAVREGITHILATPHHMSYSWNNEKQTVIRMVDELQAELDARNIPLTIFPGQEVRVYGELLEDIERGTIQFVDEGDRYLLIEFPSSAIPHYVDQLFFDLQTKGITPVIVHPERNQVIQERPGRLKRLVEKGALAQLTAASYTGGFGKQIRRLSNQLIEANLVHLIASDSHDVKKRGYHMKKAYDLLEREHGRDRLEEFEQTTKQMINGEHIVPSEPLSVKKKTIFGLF